VPAMMASAKRAQSKISILLPTRRNRETSDMARMSSEMASGGILSAGGGGFWPGTRLTSFVRMEPVRGARRRWMRRPCPVVVLARTAGHRAVGVCLRQGRGAGRYRCGARGCLSSPGRVDPAARCCAAPHPPHPGECRRAPIDPTLWSHSCP